MLFKGFLKSFKLFFLWFLCLSILPNRVSGHAHRKERRWDHRRRGGIQTAGRETPSGPNTEGAGGETAAGGGEVSAPRTQLFTGPRCFWFVLFLSEHVKR